MGGGRGGTDRQNLGIAGGGGGGDGIFNISKYVNIFLSTNPTTFILSSLVREFCQRI